jgi:hypothetical protein
MASTSLLTYAAKVASVEQVYYSPVVTLPTTNEVLSSMYCVLAKVDTWINDVSPPSPTQDQKAVKNFLKNVFVAKLVTSNDISPVIPRVDWTLDTVYDQYADDVDMFALDPFGNQVYTFYVKNRYDQVFKCLSNNNGGPSLYEPYFEPGTYTTNNIYQNVDGYKWKYIFTVDLSSKVKFMDQYWIPVLVGQNTPNPIASSAGTGSLDVINVISGGSGYDPTTSVITLNITGDGSGANGVAIVANGAITDILMTSPGSNYTYANASIISANGSGAILAANTSSPIGGHGYDPVSDLGCMHVMISVEFNGSENQNIPTDITYHQIGLLINPTTNSLSPLSANGSIYNTSTSVIVAGGFGSFVNDELVFQGASLASATFIGTVLDFNTSSNELSLINITGTLTVNAPIFGNGSGTARTVLAYNEPDFVPLSGYLSYMENRSGITRSPDGIEQFKIVLGY